MKLEPKNVSVVGAIIVTVASVATATYEAWCSRKSTKLYEEYLGNLTDHKNTNGDDITTKKGIETKEDLKI